MRSRLRQGKRQNARFFGDDRAAIQKETRPLFDFRRADSYARIGPVVLKATAQASQRRRNRFVACDRMLSKTKPLAGRHDKRGKLLSTAAYKTVFTYMFENVECNTTLNISKTEQVRVPYAADVFAIGFNYGRLFIFALRNHN